MRFSSASLGLKLNLALVFFFLMLGGLTTAIILYGFNRTQHSATDRSQEALEEQGKLALRTIVSDQGKYDGLAIEAAAEMGFRASNFLATYNAAGERVPVDASSLARTEGGMIYDPNPSRTSDVAIPNYVDLNQEVLDDIAYSAPMDFIYAALMESFPESLREENLEPIAISFITPNSVVRYYPPIGVHALVPPDVNVTSVAARQGPEANPERRINWRTPYEDAAGRGLVITAEVPAYDADTYRGTFQVDLSIAKLVAQLNTLKLTPTGFAFYVDQKGEILKGDAYDLINAEVERGNAAVQATLESMRNGEQGVTRATINSNDMFIGYAPIPGVGGSLAMGASVEELTASAAAITSSIGDEESRTLRTTLFAMGALFVAGLAGATYLNRQVLLKPIEALASGTRAATQGDLDTSIPVTGEDELAVLALSFNQMTSDLKQRRDALRQEINEREAAQGELQALFAAMTDSVVVLNRDGLYLRVPATNAPALLMPPEDLAGKHMRDVMPAGQADEFIRLVGQALTRQQTTTQEYPLEIDGRTYWFSAAISPISQDEVLVVARDITDRVLARQELERQVAERTQELTALLGISSDLASTLELGPLLALIIEDVRRVADYSRCSIYTVEGDSIVLLDSRSLSPAEAMAPVRVPIEVLEPFWAAIRAGKPAIIDDVRGDTAQAQAYRRGAGDLIETAFKGIRSWMGVPLAIKDRLIGILMLSHPQPAFYTERHASLVAAIATQVAVAIDNARLYEQAQQLAAVEERQRLARELHDSVSQALYGIALGARTARTLMDRDPSTAVEPIDYVLSLAEAGLAEMRALIFELRPESLEIEGVVAALEKQIAATAARYGIEVTARLDAEPPLTLTQREVFYRIAQEALHNVVKHAHATKAEVRLASEDGSVVLEVRDNGAGFDPSGSFPGHMGLVSMQERAEQYRRALSRSRARPAPALASVCRCHRRNPPRPD